MVIRCHLWKEELPRFLLLPRPVQGFRCGGFCHSKLFLEQSRVDEPRSGQGQGEFTGKELRSQAAFYLFILS